VIKSKQFEIFCGTGGVGKTTLATSRATYLSAQGKSILLITIDPSKRLKEILSLKEEDAGTVQLTKNPYDESTTFDTLLMNPAATMKRIGQLSEVKEISENRILKILSKPYGGLNEILSIVELNFQYGLNKYDTIVLDTPPGSHFLDFLESCTKINAFFDKSYIEIFSYLGKKITKEQQKRSIMKMFISSGVKKLLAQLQKVTGAEFIDDFVEAVAAIYKAKGPFMEGLRLQEGLKNKATSNWFLVTSVEQDKFKEAMEIKAHATDFFHADTYLLINKSQSENWEGFEAESEILGKLKDKVIKKEKHIKRSTAGLFSETVFFDEIIDPSPINHVLKLTKRWGQDLNKQVEV
jgi:anion-transporting  ArsA/GET3 family ATPase